LGTILSNVNWRHVETSAGPELTDIVASFEEAISNVDHQEKVHEAANRNCKQIHVKLTRDEWFELEILRDEVEIVVT